MQTVDARARTETDGRTDGTDGRRRHTVCGTSDAVLPAHGGRPHYLCMPIMALFAEHDEQPYSEQRWHEGLVVRFDGESEHPYLTFFETDSVWEPMDLPDVTVAFRSEKRADVCIAVCESMLPGDDDLSV